MKIAITGSTGRVGRAIYIHLSKYHQVIGLDRSASSTADIVADLEDKVALEKLLNGVDAVIHTAALHAPHVGYFSDKEFERINVQATERLLNACFKYDINKFVLTSTTALYGDAINGEEAVWLDETVSPIPRTIYHKTKLKAEELVKEAVNSGGFSGTVLRMSRCFPEPVNLMASYRLHRGIDARDVATAHRWAIECENEDYQMFVVSGGTPFKKEDCEILKKDASKIINLRCPELAKEFNQRGWVLPNKIDRVCVPNLLISKGWTPKFGVNEVLNQFDSESSEILIPKFEKL